MNHTDPVFTIPLVGMSYEAKLHNLNIFTLFDLLNHFPARYEDTSKIVGINDLNKETKQTVIAKVTSLTNVRLRGGKSLQKGIIADENTAIEVAWFNQPFLSKNICLEKDYYFYGKLNPKQLKPQLLSPDYQIHDPNRDNTHLGRIVPIYPLTKGITTKWLRSRIKYLIDNLEKINGITEHLPLKITTQYGLLKYKAALKLIHFPEELVDINNSRKRLAFDELIAIQLKLLAEKQKRMLSTAPNIIIKPKYIKDFQSSLSFKLTKSQKQSIEDVFMDYSRGYPMRRLIQGDVGSGKTIVAIISGLPVISSGYQIVFLTPTSILAKQHYQTLKSYITDIKVNIQLITSDTIKDIDTTSKIDIIIGTHAVLHHKKKLIKNIGLLVIDEQHRFGVDQRREILNLENSSERPHLMYLTATPIPRTLAQVLFSEFDVSIVEKIAKRKEVATFLVPDQKRTDSKPWIEKIINQGSQVFWICPLIEENAVLKEDLKSINQYYNNIKQAFPKNKVAILHGKMKSSQKDEILENFKNGKFDILLSTTVIEVGIDIPQANLIIIENAERYGLAQLHQLRGRVGRNDQQAWCLLFTAKESEPETIKRLQFFTSEHDGIKISKFDLERRGPGEVYGTIQSGLPQLKVANFSNLEIIKQTGEAAKSIFNKS